MGRHIVSVVGLVYLAVSSAAACSPDSPINSPDSPINRVLGEVGFTCVDAVGSNSTAEQIGVAQLNTEFTDPDTGETTTAMEIALEMDRELSEVFESPSHSRDEILNNSIESVFTDVPDGGDAAFAAAVCDEVNVSVWEALTGQGIADDTLATTPHLLRGFGRSICGSMGDSYAEAVLKDQSDEVKEATDNPTAFKEKQLSLLNEALEAAEAQPDLLDVEAARSALETFSATPADAIAANLESMLRMQWLAVEHQCPASSRYGFGPGCGEFNPFPDGKDVGILRVRGGHLSCENAQTVIRWHYFPSQADGNSPLSWYHCQENGFEDVPGAPVFIECEPKQGNPDPARIIVTPP